MELEADQFTTHGLSERTREVGSFGGELRETSIQNKAERAYGRGDG